MLSTTKIRTTVVPALPILLPTSAAEPKRDANIWLCNGLNGNGPGWTRTSDLPIMSRQL